MEASSVLPRGLHLATPRGAALPGIAVAGIVGARLLLGAVFILREGLDKFQHWTTARSLIRFVSPGVTNPQVPGFYRAFLTDVVVPNADVFRVVVMSSELLLGVCLIIGFSIRIAAVLQSFALLNYIIVKTPGAASANSDITMIILFFALFMVSAGRYYGVDGLLRARFRWLRWL